MRIYFFDCVVTLGDLSRSHFSSVHEGGVLGLVPANFHVRHTALGHIDRGGVLANKLGGSALEAPPLHQLF